MFYRQKHISLFILIAKNKLHCVRTVHICIHTLTLFEEASESWVVRVTAKYPTFAIRIILWTHKQLFNGGLRQTKYHAFRLLAIFVANK